jgi:transposase-like protein
MTKKQIRRTFTAEQKAAILRRHVLDKVSISDLSHHHGHRHPPQGACYP